MHTYFLRATSFLLWYCLMDYVYQHIQTKLYGTASNVTICDCWSNWMQERDIPEKWTCAAIKQNKAGFSTRTEGMWTGPPGLLTGQHRIICERFIHGKPNAEPLYGNRPRWLTRAVKWCHLKYGVVGLILFPNHWTEMQRLRLQKSCLKSRKVVSLKMLLREAFLSCPILYHSSATLSQVVSRCHHWQGKMRCMNHEPVSICLEPPSLLWSSWCSTNKVPVLCSHLVLLATHLGSLLLFHSNNSHGQHPMS